MKYDKNNLPVLNKSNTLFFWGHQPGKDGKIGKSCLSQWWMSDFSYADIQFCCAEQWMMAQKAALFNNNDILSSILESNSPKEMKSLGRKIKGFNEKTWSKHKFDIVLFGSYLKFNQNKNLNDFLLNTGSLIIVEASPYDTIWGIGLSAEDSNYDPDRWKGENFLGFALMEVRDAIMNNIKVNEYSFL